jgi:hypothetical protein
MLPFPLSEIWQHRASIGKAAPEEAPPSLAYKFERWLLRRVELLPALPQYNHGLCPNILHKLLLCLVAEWSFAKQSIFILSKLHLRQQILG